MGLVFLSALGAFLLGLTLLRVLRRRITGGKSLAATLDNEAADFPFSAVIQELKQQKFALQNEQQLQRRRSKISESITSAVIAHLPCGVLFVSPNGLVRQANPAARQMLGFASPLGMRAEELFEGERTVPGEECGKIAGALENAFQGETRAADLECSYQTPAGEARVLKVGVIPLRETSGEALGVALLLNDETRQAERREAEAFNAETSAELALELHNSVLTICEYAERISASEDQQQNRKFAEDIRMEAGHLEKVVGGFLARNGAADKKAAAWTVL